MSQSFGDTAFSPKGVIWVLNGYGFRDTVPRYVNVTLVCIVYAKKNIFCSKYMIKLVIDPIIPYDKFIDVMGLYENYLICIMPCS